MSSGRLTGLVRVNLSKNLLDSDALGDLCAIILRSHSIKELDLSHNGFDTKAVRRVGARFDALSGTPSLQSSGPCHHTQ